MTMMTSNALVAIVSILFMILLSSGFFSKIIYQPFTMFMTIGFVVSTTLLLLLLYIVLFSRDDSYRLSNMVMDANLTNQEATAKRRRLFYSGLHKEKKRSSSNATAADGGGDEERKIGFEAGNVEWLNLILHRVMTKFLFSQWEELREKILERATEAMHLPDVLGDIDLRGLEIGRSAPVFHHIDARETEDQSLEIDAHVEYEDARTRFDLATEIIINYPYPNFARVPVEFGLENIYLHAKLRVVISPDFSKAKLFFTSRPEYDMFFSNAFGYRHVMKNVPKLTDILIRVINRVLTEKLVYPNFVEFNIGAKEPKEKTKKGSKKAAGPDENTTADRRKKTLNGHTFNLIQTPPNVARFRQGTSAKVPDGFPERYDIDEFDSSASRFRQRLQKSEGSGVYV